MALLFQLSTVSVARSSTPRIASIAWSIRCATSRLAVSRPRERAVGVIELAGEPRPIGAERVDLRKKRFLAAIELAAPLGRRFERVKRERQPLARDLDGIVLAHLAIQCGHKRRAPHVKSVRPQLFTHGSLRRIELKRQRPKRFVPSPVHDAVRPGGRAIDSRAVACYLIAACSRDRGRPAYAPRLARFMTMPDRILAASATLAQPSRFPATATSPAARAEHDRMANAIRALAMDAVEQAKAGHPGLPMGAADIATVLFTRFLKFDPDRSGLARSRPLRALGRSRLDADLCAASSSRLRDDDDRRDQALPADRLAHARSSRIRPHARHRDHDRSARPRDLPMRSAWRSPNATSPLCSATTSSITRPTCSPPTAI